GVRFGALQDAVPGREFDRLETICVFSREPFLKFLLGEWIPENIPADAVTEVGDLAGESAMPPPHGGIEPDGVFRLQVGVADLECEVANVRAKEVELLESGVARRARQVHGKRELVVGGRRTEDEAN